MIENVRITISDMRPLYCVNGVRKAFNAADVDFKDFLQNGAMSHDLIGRGYDGMIERVVDAIKEREDGRR